MKKKILFVIPSLDSGGGEKSLINLLNTIDYNLYEVDLVLFKKRGLFLTLVPENVSITEISGNYIHFSKGLLTSCWCFLMNFNLKLVFFRILFTLKNSWIKNRAVAEQNSWNAMAHSIPVLPKMYDVAVAFLEKSSIYYVVDKVNAAKKIGWIHTNYSSSGLNPNFDSTYFSKLQALITVSPECEQSLKLNFPTCKERIHTIHNIVSSKTVQKLAEEKLTDADFQPNEFTIVTVARLSKEKGIDIAVEACKNLVALSNEIKWYVIGDGSEKSHLENLIHEYQLQNNFHFLGLKSNPYPYVKSATIYVQPSRYEGKSIAIDEAKILEKPIVVTNFTTAKDQLNHKITGIISDSNAQILAHDIMALLNDKNLQNELISNLKKEVSDNSFEEINKFYKVINE